MTSKTPRYPQVFISYAGEDTEIAQRVCAALEDEGIPCWIAPRDIRPGVEYGEAIVEAIRNARILVLVFSASANASVQVRREVERAVSNNLEVIPFRIEDLQPAKALEYFLSATHWLDAFSEPLDEHLLYLVDTVKAGLSHSPAGATPSPRRRWAIRKRLPRWALPAAAAAVILSSLAWISPAWREWWRPPVQNAYRLKAAEAFNSGRYEEARRALDLWRAENPADGEAQEFLARVVRMNRQLESFQLALKERDYEGAGAALLVLRELNPRDPGLPQRQKEFENTFSPAFQDEFLGGLDFWDAPDAWSAGRGKLLVQGPGVGWVKDWYYGDFDAWFNLTLENQAAAGWIVRGRAGDGFYFQLTGPHGKPPNSFAAFRYSSGRREALLGPIAAGGDLSVPGDQFRIHVKARGETIQHTIEIASAPQDEPRMLGIVRDGAFTSGRFGFTTRAGEVFCVRALKIVPLKDGEGS